MCRSNGHQSATGDVLGPTPQAGVRHTPGCLLLMLRINSPCRHPDLPPMRRPATRHCQHRGAGGDRADSQAPWPGGRADRSCASEPGTAPVRSADLTPPPMPTSPGHRSACIAAFNRPSTPRLQHAPNDSTESAAQTKAAYTSYSQVNYRMSGLSFNLA